MGGVIELFLIMLVVATAAFLPLGYFIYKYTQKNGQPFGETEPHGDSPSLVNDLAETVIHFVKSKFAKK
ncbi:MAG: hypothetical protein QX196_09285 [Methylococcaceae bacterium]|jgi:hypothetical protein